jgi:hypothetical protein
MKRVRVGDVFEIPLPDGRKAYGQYVYRDERKGTLIQVFDLVVQHEASLEEISNAGPLFPPVFTGLFAAIRTGLWRIVGHVEVEEFVYPEFISPLYDSKIGRVRRWYLWDGENYHDLGRQLPHELRNLEQLVVWDPNDVVHRVATGENPLDFRLYR